MNSMKLSTLNDNEIDTKGISSIDRVKLGEFIKELPRFYGGTAANGSVSKIANSQMVQRFK